MHKKTRTNRRVRKQSTKKKKHGGKNTPNSIKYPDKISKVILEKVSQSPYNMPNTDVIEFFLEFLKRRRIVKILEDHTDVINNLTTQKLSDVSKTLVDEKPFRELVRDVLKWCIMEFNVDLVNTILAVLVEAISFKHFFLKFIPSDGRVRKPYPLSLYLIMYFLCEKIKPLSAAKGIEKVELYNFLRFILHLLVIYQDTIQDNFITDAYLIPLQKNKLTILCVLDYCIKNNTVNNNVKELMSKFMDQLSLNWAAALKNNVFMTAGIVKSCAGKVIQDTTRNITENVRGFVVGSLRMVHDKAERIFSDNLIGA